MSVPAVRAECLIDYRPPAMQGALGVWAVLLPILGLPIYIGLCGVCCMLAGAAVSGVIWEGTIVAAMTVCLLFLGACASILLLLTALLADDRIVLTRNGLCFPLFLAPALGMKRMRPWSDLRELHYFATAKSDGVLQLSFKSGGALRLKTSALAKPQLESFLVACEVCHPDVQITPELARLREELSDAVVQQPLSFTQLWDQEFESRFGATAFVPLTPGQALNNGQLRIVRRLSFGGLAAVYLAQQNGRELVVVKEAVLLPNMTTAKRTKAIQLFEREATLLSGIDHPQIARLLGHFEEENRTYQVLQYIPGRNLRQLVAHEGPQSEKQVLDWAKNLATILEYLHGQEPPILHRDITPENIVVSEQWFDPSHLYLIDFGVSNHFLGTATGTIVGKQAFMAPEQFRGKPVPVSDLYSLGGTLYFLLTGQNPKALCQCHVREHNPSISQAADSLIADLTNQDPSSRPSSAAHLVTQIESLLTAPVKK